MTDPMRSPDLQPLGRRLNIAAKAVRELADAVLVDHGSDLTTWIVLQHAKAPGGLALSQRELADRLHIGGPALVRHLDRLEQNGLVRRRRDDHDRRITRITVTPKGRRLLTRLETVMADQDRRMRSQLSAPEVRTLERALTKLHDYAVGAHGADGHGTESA